MPREGTATEERSRGKNKRHGSVNRVCRLCNVAAPRASACVCACVCARGSARTTRTGHGTLRSGSIAPWHARTEPRSPEAISSIPWPVGPNMVRIIRSHRRQKRGTQHALPPERVPIYRTPLAPVEKTRNKTPSNKNKKQTVHERRPGGGVPQKSAAAQCSATTSSRSSHEETTATRSSRKPHLEDVVAAPACFTWGPSG